LSSTWAIKKKQDGRYQARMNTRGYEWRDGIHYNDADKHNRLLRTLPSESYHVYDGILDDESRRYRRGILECTSQQNIVWLWGQHWQWAVILSGKSPQVGQIDCQNVRCRSRMQKQATQVYGAVDHRRRIRETNGRSSRYHTCTAGDLDNGSQSKEEDHLEDWQQRSCQIGELVDIHRKDAKYHTKSPPCDNG
jgi:hypothetical protein